MKEVAPRFEPDIRYDLWLDIWDTKVERSIMQDSYYIDS